MKNSVWSAYENGDIKQEFSSEKTARLQKPRTLGIIEKSGLYKSSPKLLDIGCGSGNRYNKEKLTEMGVQYNGCDPFNQPANVNLAAIENCRDGQADLVTVNNVLNTIKEPEVWADILKQAQNAVNPDSGRVLVIVYEGEKTSKERQMEKETGIKMNGLTPIATKDGFQNRMKTEAYMDAVKEVFPNVQLVSMGSSNKVIVAAMNPTLDLDLKAMAKQEANMSFMSSVTSAMEADKASQKEPEPTVDPAVIAQQSKLTNAKRSGMRV